LPIVPQESLTVPGRWEGEILTQAGHYNLRVLTKGTVQLSIGDNLVLNKCAAQEEEPDMRAGDATLDAGWHHIRIDYYPNSVGDALVLSWTRPDGVSEVIPPDAFRLGQGIGLGSSVFWPDVPPASPGVPCQ